MKIAVLTGAGISAESGLRTFRASDGLWEDHRIEDVATPEGFAADPALVHRFYNMRRQDAAAAQPNAAHRALARLAEHARVTLITQNVDDLHERGGSSKVIHMHGALGGALCAKCEHRWTAPMVMQPSDACPACGAQATRPDIVWFGEIPYQMDMIWDALTYADIFVAIGTSGQVYPAAAFAQHADRVGVHTVELNLEPSVNSGDFAEHHQGLATEIVPAWVDRIIAEGR